MSRILAVDWDEHEARYVLASLRRGKVSILRATSVPMVDVVEGGGDPRPDLGNSLRAALADQKLGHPQTLVAVDRRSIEVLNLTLPPATDKELPTLVANQVMRESATVTEDSIIDFVPQSDDPTQPRIVTAAAISETQVKQIKETCGVAGLKPKRLVMRPNASASLFTRGQTIDEDAETLGPSLLVNVVGDEVDLTVLDGGRIVYSRTARMPAGTDEAVVDSRLLGEINRTRAVAMQGSLAGEPIESVFVFGNPGERQDLVDDLNAMPDLTASHFDPFAVVELAEGPIPEQAGRFAALIGMVLDEAASGVKGRKHAIDFLRPRKPIAPPNPRRKFALAGMFVAAALGVGGNHFWNEKKLIDEENALLETKLINLTNSYKRLAKKQQLVAAVNQWQASDVMWLEELREMSLRFPADQEAVVLRMALGPPRGSKGSSMSFQVLVRDESLIRAIESAFRDRYHSILTPGARRNENSDDYPWAFGASVNVAKRKKAQYVEHLSQETP